MQAHQSGQLLHISSKGVNRVRKLKEHSCSVFRVARQLTNQSTGTMVCAQHLQKRSSISTWGAIKGKGS